MKSHNPEDHNLSLRESVQAVKAGTWRQEWNEGHSPIPTRGVEGTTRIYPWFMSWLLWSTFPTTKDALLILDEEGRPYSFGEVDEGGLEGGGGEWEKGREGEL